MAVLTEEQSMLRDAAKSWVQEKSPVTAFRKVRDSGVDIGYDAAAWNEMAEMGWAGVIIPRTSVGRISAICPWAWCLRNWAARSRPLR